MKICNFVNGCGACPYLMDCEIDFSTQNDKEFWIEDIKNKIENLQKLLDKVEQA